MGELALRQGDYAQARAYYEELLPLTKEMGRGAWMVAFLGYVHLRQGDATSAHVQFEEGLRRFFQEGRKIGVVYALEGLASLAVMQGHPERAVRLFGWAEAMREAIDNRRPPIEQTDVDRDIATIHALVDETTFMTAWAEGRAISMEQAIEIALDQVDS